MDRTATQSLIETLQKKRGAPLTINASKVNRVGIQCIQVLIAALTTWSDDEMTFRITHPSAALLNALELVGLEPAKLSIELDT